MNGKNRLAIFMSLLCAVSFSSPAFAGYTCTGLVRGVSMDFLNGELLAESVGGVSWPRLCSFRSAINSIQPEDCKRMYAALLTAQSSAKSVTLWVNDSNTTCATLTPWAYVNGLYFLRIDG